MSEPLKPPVNHQPVPEPEFVDEEPGSYLSELGTRTYSALWGLANCALTVTVAQILSRAKIGPESDWLTLARLMWILLPVSAVLLIILTVWQQLTAYTKKSPRKAIAALVTSHASIGIWLYYSRSLALISMDS